MDWQKIKEGCPKAFQELAKKYKPSTLEYFEIKNIEQEGSEFSMLYDFGKGKEIIKGVITRDLYDFFDENGIMINVLEAGILTQDNSHYNKFIWVITSLEGVYNHNYPYAQYPPRAEAETAAFERAFEILESKLNKEA
jgi:hypothetical protein